MNVFEATLSLIQDSALAIEEELDFENSDEPCLSRREVDRPALFGLLKQHIQSLTFPPVALGIGRTSIEDKAAALLYAMFLDVSYQNLKARVRLCILPFRRSVSGPSPRRPLPRPPPALVTPCLSAPPPAGPCDGKSLSRLAHFGFRSRLSAIPS